ncbi:hypothetical protein [Mesorhizobium sp. M0058]|uniref:hypothetical protein n=1 Tax=Mesorhizobium sp. M0058 TaxID=2956865 RepID=UPI00333CEA24
MTDQYGWWRQALKLAGGGGRELTRDQLALLSLSEDNPESGFFRNRPFKDAPLVPVAIWRDGQRIICLQGGKEADAQQVWSYACRNPISEALYHSVLAGGAWPDEPPAVAKEHNLPAKTGDLHKDLAVELAAEKEMAEAFLKKPITTQEQADQAAIWSKRLAAINKKATEQFTVEKRPWLDGGTAVDDKWREVRTDSEALGKKLKKHLDAWLAEQARLERVRQQEARDKADRIRREAEAAAQRAADLANEAAANAVEGGGGVASLFSEEVEKEADRLAQQAADADREAQARPVFAGRTGAKVTQHTYWIATITDYDALLQAVKNDPEVRQAVENVAARIARNKDATVPAGMERVEDKRAA